MISPPNTFDSVVRELREGLEHGTIVVPQQFRALEDSPATRRFGSGDMGLLAERFAQVFGDCNEAQITEAEGGKTGIAPLLAQKDDFSQQLKLQRKQAVQDHFLSLLAGGIGCVFILIGLALTLTVFPSSLISVSMAGGIVLSFLSVLFGRQAHQAQERINAIFEAFLNRTGGNRPQYPQETTTRAESAPRK